MNINLKWSRKGIDCMAKKIRNDGECAELPALICLDMIVMLQAEVKRQTAPARGYITVIIEVKMPPVYAKDLLPGDKIPCLEYGSLLVESVLPHDPRYPLSCSVETDRGRRVYLTDKVMQVVREDA